MCISFPSQSRSLPSNKHALVSDGGPRQLLTHSSEWRPVRCRCFLCRSPRHHHSNADDEILIPVGQQVHSLCVLRALSCFRVGVVSIDVDFIYGVKGAYRTITNLLFRHPSDLAVIGASQNEPSLNTP